MVRTDEKNHYGLIFLDQNLDVERYWGSIARLEEIFRGISRTTSEVSTWRCPYKNVQGRCTAGFGCRNQDRTVQPGDLFTCAADDKLDYRSAWDV